MKLDRAITIQRELQTQAIDLVSRAKMRHNTHAELCERFNQLFERYPSDLPAHVRQYARGYYSALVDSLYHTNLVHGYEWQETIYTKWESYPEDLKEYIRAHSTDSIKHGHYWADTLESKENKPFFVR